MKLYYTTIFGFFLYDREKKKQNTHTYARIHTRAHTHWTKAEFSLQQVVQNYQNRNPWGGDKEIPLDIFGLFSPKLQELV